MIMTMADESGLVSRVGAVSVKNAAQDFRSRSDRASDTLKGSSMISLSPLRPVMLARVEACRYPVLSF